MYVCLLDWCKCMSECNKHACVKADAQNKYNKNAITITKRNEINTQLITLK